jgi:mRNA interferase MazF
MTSYNPGDLAEFPFAGSKGTKKRPAVVLLDTGDSDVVLARVTTQLRHTSYVLGLLQPADRQQVSNVLRLTFGNW